MTQSSTAAAEMQKSSASEPPKASPPVVDPSPYAAPIALNNQSLEELMSAHPAAASDPYVLAIKPRDYWEATTGADAQISQVAYVEMTKPDGTTFLSPLANVSYYRRKGYTEGDQRDIPDLVAYWAERARGAVSEEIIEGQTQEPDQPPDEVLLRYAGVPKTADELEAERQEAEDFREGLAREGETDQYREQREKDEKARRGGQGTPSTREGETDQQREQRERQGTPPAHAGVPGPPAHAGVPGPPAHAEGTPPAHAGPPPPTVSQGPANQPEGEPKAP
jgi:hypothetical protein